MIRHTLAFIVLIALASVLVACGGNASSPAPTASNTPPATAPPAATPPPTTPPPAPTPAPSSTPSCNYSYATLKGSNGADATSLYGINDNGAMVGTDSAGHGFI